MLIKVSEKKIINDIRGTYEGKNRIENRGEKYKKRFREGEGGPQGREYIYIHTHTHTHTELRLICVVIWQKPTQHCKTV